MLILQQQKHIVGKRRKSGKTAAKSGNQKYIHIGRYQMSFLGHSEENTDNKATDDIHGKSAPGKGRRKDVMGQLPH